MARAPGNVRASRERGRLAAIADAFLRHGVPMHRDLLAAMVVESSSPLFSTPGELASFLRDHNDVFPSLGEGVYWSRHAELVQATREGATSERLTELGNVCWLGLRDPEAAEKAYSDALCRDTSNLRARRGLVEVYLDLGKLPEAAGVLNWLRWRLPREVRTLKLAARCAERMEDWDQAIDAWLLLVEMSPEDPGYLLHLATAAFHAEDPEIAAEALGRLLNVDPDIAPALVLRARLEFEAGDIDGAMESLTRALELDVGLVARTCPGALIDAFLDRSAEREHWARELDEYLRLA